LQKQRFANVREELKADMSSIEAGPYKLERPQLRPQTPLNALLEPFRLYRAPSLTSAFNIFQQRIHQRLADLQQMFGRWIDSDRRKVPGAEQGIQRGRRTLNTELRQHERSTHPDHQHVAITHSRTGTHAKPFIR
jgi:hypothetical protein